MKYRERMAKKIWICTILELKIERNGTIQEKTNLEYRDIFLILLFLHTQKIYPIFATKFREFDTFLVETDTIPNERGTYHQTYRSHYLAKKSTHY